jgi:hypothetical protein
MIMFWDLWHQFKYYMIAGTAVLVVVIVLSVIMITNWMASRDVIFMTDIKRVSYGLEQYYEQHHAYPLEEEKGVGNKEQGGQASGVLSLNRAITLSDAGFGTADGTVYYQGAVTNGTASYQSDGQNYTISFKLRRKWSDLGATGRKCTVTQGYVVACGK